MIVRFPRHRRARCTTQNFEYHSDTSCAACNLYLCAVCLGAEGDLPSDCPGREMTREERALVLAGDLDFRSDVGWVSEMNARVPPRRSFRACVVVS